jgi:hypothetical protein
MATVYAAATTFSVNHRHCRELISNKPRSKIVNRAYEVMLICEEHVSRVHRCEDAVSVIMIPPDHLVVEFLLFILVEWGCTRVRSYGSDFPEGHIGIELPMSKFKPHLATIVMRKP